MLRRLLALLGLVAALWIVSYAVLSFAGGYLPAGGALVWQPRWCALRRERLADGRVRTVAEGAAWAYAPLIVLDRRWLHSDERPPEAGAGSPSR